GGNNTGVAIVADQDTMRTARYLGAELRIRTGLDFPIYSASSSSGSKNHIGLRIKPNKRTAAECYELAIQSQDVEIRGHDEAGVFYGVQTLLQLLPAAQSALARS